MAARRSEAEARKEAEANFNMAQQAVDDYLTNVSENTLLKEQDTLDIRSLRKDLLSRPCDTTREFVSQRRHDPQLREQLANAYFRVGEITQVIDSSQDALAAFRFCPGLLGVAGAGGPRQPRFQIRLADCYFAVASSGSPRTCPRPELAQAGRSVSTSTCAVDHPREPAFQASLAACYSEIGLCLSESSDSQGHLDYLHQGPDDPAEAG